MERFRICLADTVIEIHSLHSNIKQMCLDYLCKEKPQIQVVISQRDIERERAIGKRKGNVFYTDAYLETLAVCRKIAEELADREILLIHGSSVAVDKRAYLFAAPSGTGKSTHAKLWCGHFKERAVMINDDKPLLKVTDSQVTVYGTPWNGKHKRGNNVRAPLYGICFLHQAENNRIFRLQEREAYANLIRQIYLPAENESAVQKVLHLADKLMRIPMYQMGCDISEEAVLTAYGKMKGEDV